MRVIIIILTLLLIVSCGKEEMEKCYDNTGDRNNDGVTDVNDCVGLSGIPGPKGKSGKIGATGDTGESGERGESGINGESGKDGIDGATGESGTPGADGEQGPAGKDGADYTDKLVYEGYFCGRTVISLGEAMYVIHGQLIPLSDQWYKISNTCKLRYIDDYIEEKKT